MKSNIIYKIISVVAFLVLIFILALPKFYNVNKKKNTEVCIRNMKIIYTAIKGYMSERGESFNGDQDDLVRSGYLKHTYSCPEAKPGDKYIISGDKTTGEITVICPKVKEFPNHKLPESLK